MVDDEKIDGASFGFQLETELGLDGGEDILRGLHVRHFPWSATTFTWRRWCGELHLVIQSIH